MDNMDKEFIKSAEIVNADDKDYTDGNALLIALGSYGEHKFVVYARNLQEGLELLGQYCKTQGYTGLLSDYDAENEYFDEQYFPVNGGEFYLQMPTYTKEIIL